MDHRPPEYLLRILPDLAAGRRSPVAGATQQNIAADLDTARGVVSRRLQELQSVGTAELRRRGIVSKARRVVVRVVA